jgi:hypothetical protein
MTNVFSRMSKVASLLSLLPRRNGTFVALTMRTVKTFSNLAEAGFASSLLEASGIAASLADEQSFLWSYGVAIPIRLQVDEEDAERAIDILTHGPQAAEEIPGRFAGDAGALVPIENGTIPTGLFVTAAAVLALLLFPRWR